MVALGSPPPLAGARATPKDWMPGVLRAAPKVMPPTSCCRPEADVGGTGVHGEPSHPYPATFYSCVLSPCDGWQQRGSPTERPAQHFPYRSLLPACLYPRSPSRCLRWVRTFYSYHFSGSSSAKGGSADKWDVRLLTRPERCFPHGSTAGLLPSQRSAPRADRCVPGRRSARRCRSGVPAERRARRPEGGSAPPRTARGRRSAPRSGDFCRCPGGF